MTTGQFKFDEGGNVSNVAAVSNEDLRDRAMVTGDLFAHADHEAGKLRPRPSTAPRGLCRHDGHTVSAHIQVPRREEIGNCPEFDGIPREHWDEVKRNGFMPYEMAENLVLQNFPHYTKTEARYQLDRVMNNTEIWRIPFYSHSTILLYHGCLLVGEFGIKNDHHDENCECDES